MPRFPSHLPLGPSSRHESRGVLELFRTCSTSVMQVVRRWRCRSPQSSIPFSLARRGKERVRDPRWRHAGPASRGNQQGRSQLRERCSIGAAPTPQRASWNGPARGRRLTGSTRCLEQAPFYFLHTHSFGTQVRPTCIFPRYRLRRQTRA